VSRLEDARSLRSEVAELRHEMQLGFVRVDARFTRLEDLLVAQKNELTGMMAADKKELIGVIAATADRTTANLMKWSFSSGLAPWARSPRSRACSVRAPPASSVPGYARCPLAFIALARRSGSGAGWAESA
jgi:hypothetical protein